MFLISYKFVCTLGKDELYIMYRYYFVQYN